MFDSYPDIPPSAQQAIIIRCRWRCRCRCRKNFISRDIPSWRKKRGPRINVLYCVLTNSAPTVRSKSEKLKKKKMKSLRFLVLLLWPAKWCRGIHFYVPERVVHKIVEEHITALWVEDLVRFPILHFSWIHYTLFYGAAWRWTLKRERQKTEFA
jgi:hypothetical protein